MVTVNPLIQGVTVATPTMPLGFQLVQVAVGRPVARSRRRDLSETPGGERQRVTTDVCKVRSVLTSVEAASRRHHQIEVAGAQHGVIVAQAPLVRSIEPLTLLSVIARPSFSSRPSAAVMPHRSGRSGNRPGSNLARLYRFATENQLPSGCTLICQEARPRHPYLVVLRFVTSRPSAFALHTGRNHRRC